MGGRESGAGVGEGARGGTCESVRTVGSESVHVEDYEHQIGASVLHPCRREARRKQNEPLIVLVVWA